MSSFIVNDLTINRIVTFLFEYKGRYGNPFADIKKEFREMGFKIVDLNENFERKAFGTALKILNAKAVFQRYKGKISVGEIEATKEYKYQIVRTSLHQAYNHLRCLTYQMSEGDVPETELFKVLEKLETEMAIEIAEQTKEVKDAEWEAHEEEIKQNI